MNDDKKPVISLTTESPYIVVNLKRFENLHGKKYPLKPIMGLCRCGESNDKPYCDGAHKEKGIDWEKKPDRHEYRWKNYAGDEITIHFNPAVCSHDGSCRDNLPSVFNIDRRPWINTNGASVDEIIEVIKLCPSGALCYSIGGQRYSEFYSGEPLIRASKKGPIEVLGGIKLNDDQGEKPETEDHYVLCGCGWSKNKPFCDGHHLEKLKQNNEK